MKATRGFTRFREWLGIVLVFALGAAITFGIAFGVSNENAKNNEAAFAREADNARYKIQREIERHVSALYDIGTFAYATWPGDVPEWHRYVKDRADIESYPAFNTSPGLVERVTATQLDEFIERESISESEPFQIRMMLPLADDADRLVLTRTGEEDAEGILARGVEITAALEALDVQLPTFEDGQLIVSVAGAPPAILKALGIELDEVDADISRTDVVFVQPVAAASGETIGWVLALGQLDFLLTTAIDDLQGAINLAVTAPTGPVDGPVAQYEGKPGVELADAKYQSSSDFSIGGWQWHIDVWADHDYGIAAALFSGPLILLAGFAVTVIITVLAILRRNHSERLNDARFEIELQRTLADTDSLTGLFNRQGLMSRVAESNIATAGATVFFLDLDDFKSINDIHGHAAGDQTLSLVGERLRAVARSDDLIGRLGGDEFIVVCPGLVDPLKASDKAHVMSEAISKAHSTRPLHVSIGIATSDPAVEFNINELVRQADQAMYQVKNSGSSRRSIMATADQPREEHTALHTADSPQ